MTPTQHAAAILAAFEARQAEARAAARKHYAAAYDASKVMEAAENAKLQCVTLSDEHLDCEWVEARARTQLQCHLAAAARYERDADEIGKDIRTARAVWEIRANADDFQDDDAPVPMDPQERAGLDASR